MKKINIAIDGVSGSGKSTIAKLVANKLDYNYIDTGSMYRCVAYLMIKNNVLPDQEDEIKQILEKDFNYEYLNPKVILNGEDVTLEIRKKEINEFLPTIVALPFLRKHLVGLQQKMGEEKGVVMDGRDIASVVLKDAELKIYLTSSLESRAMRRHKENIDKGIESDYESVLNNLKNRDYVDMHVSRALVKVEDAIEVDTTNMNAIEACDYIYKLALKKVKE